MRLEAASLPVVTAFAFHLQESYNALLNILQEAENVAFLNAGEDEDEDDAEKREEELAKNEVVLGELLRMALKLDYMDEIGRRKVFSVISGCQQPHPGLTAHLQCRGYGCASRTSPRFDQPLLRRVEGNNAHRTRLNTSRRRNHYRPTRR